MAKPKEEITDNGERTQRYAGRKGYAERIKKEKIKDATDDAPKDSGTDSEV